MSVSSFNVVAKKLGRFEGKMISCEKIKELIHQILLTQYSDKKAYKIIYYLKNRGYIVSMKKDIFYIKDGKSQVTEQELVEKFYRQSLREHCKTYCAGAWYIGGIKALELNVSNFDTPDEVTIVNPDKQSTEIVLLGKKVLFKKYNSNKQSAFKKLMKLTKKIKIGAYSFPVANLELAILESLYSPQVLTENYVKEILKKLIKKYGGVISIENFEEILKIGKHHTSINRLYGIAESIDPKFAQKLYGIIKRFSFVLEVE